MWPGAIHRSGGRTHLSEHDEHDTGRPWGAPLPWLPPDAAPARQPLEHGPDVAAARPQAEYPQARHERNERPQLQHPPGAGAYGGWGYASPPTEPLPSPVPQQPGSRRKRLLSTVAVVAALAVAAPVVQRELLTPTPRAARAATSATASAAPGPVTTASRPSFDYAVDEILANMNVAVMNDDVEAFSAVAARGVPRMRTRLRSLFTALRAMPLRDFELDRDPTRTSKPVTSTLPEAVAVPVVARYRLQGWDSSDVSVPLQFVVAFTDGRYSLVEDRTTVDSATARRLEPWLFSDLHVTKTANVLVLGEKAKAKQLRRLAATLERVAAHVRRVWPERTWNGRVVVYATTSTAFVRSWYGRTAAGDSGNGGHASFVAKVVTLPRADQPGAPGAVRMVLTPYLLKQGGRTGYEEVLRHEMTHVATARINYGVPTWLVEGAAEYTGFVRRTASGALDATTTLGRHGLTRAEVSSTQRGTWRPVLKTGADFYRGSEQSVDAAYNSAFITCLYIADRYGERALRRLYTRSAELAGTSPLAGALVAKTEKAALREVLRTDRARLTKDVAKFATRLRNRLVFR